MNQNGIGGQDKTQNYAELFNGLKITIWPFSHLTMFNNIIGHKNIISFLGMSVKNDAIAHAYLFYGPKNLGKRTVAEKFAETLLDKPILNHPDVYFVRREKSEKEDKLSKNISIEQMRELERKLSLSSFLNSYKIGIIEEAETMSIEAANSLLKTLEEPTAKTVIILLASNIAALPATIISRCQVLKFLPISREKIYDHLVSLGARRDEALNLANISWGKPGLAINFWQSQAAKRISTARQSRKDDSRSDDLAVYNETAAEILAAMRAATLKEKMRIFEKFLSKEKDLEKEADDLRGSLNWVLSLWSSILRDIALFQNNCGELVFNSVFFEELKNLANFWGNGKVADLHREIKSARRYLGENLNPRLVLENLVLTF